MSHSTDPVRVVDALIHHLTRRSDRRYVLEGEQSHPLLVRRLREMAGMNEGEPSGTIEVRVDGVDWSVLLSVLSGGRVELVATPAGG